jgi:phosphonate transport system substrate-binding protein
MNISKIVFLLGFSVLMICPQVEGKDPEEGITQKPLLIGLIPEQNIFKQIERYDPIAKYLAGKIGVEVKLKVLARYGNIIDNFVSLGIDGAFFGSFSYALAQRKLGVEVLARPEGLDGSSTYHGLIFVRKDSRIKGIKDMKGKRFVFVDKATTAGYLLPLAYFKAQGVKDYKAYFNETYFSGTHEDAIHDVLNKKADIGAAKNTVFERMTQADQRIPLILEILEKSPDVPENGLAVRKSLEASVKKTIQDTLLNMHDDPVGKTVLKIFGARKFILTTDKDYDPVFQYAREIKLNLAQYDYMNE